MDSEPESAAIRAQIIVDQIVVGEPDHTSDDSDHTLTELQYRPPHHDPPPSSLLGPRSLLTASHLPPIALPFSGPLPIYIETNQTGSTSEPAVPDIASESINNTESSSSARTTASASPGSTNNPVQSPNPPSVTRSLIRKDRTVISPDDRNYHYSCHAVGSSSISVLPSSTGHDPNSFASQLSADPLDSSNSRSKKETKVVPNISPPSRQPRSISAWLLYCNIITLPFISPFLRALGI